MANIVLLTALAPTPQSPDRFAVILMPAAKEAQPFVGAVTDVLKDAAHQINAVKIIMGSDLGKALNTSPDAALKKCGAHLGCFANLAKRAGASSLVLGRMITKKGAPGVRVQLLRIGVANHSIDGKVAVTIDSPGKTAAVLVPELATLLGVSTTAELTVTHASQVVEVDGKPVGRGPGPYALPAGSHQIHTGMWHGSVMLFPSAAQSVVVPAALTTVPHAPVVSTQRRVPWWQRYRREWRYGGWSVGALGVAGLIAATTMGAYAQSQFDSARSNHNLSQVQAVKIEHRGNQWAATANITFVVGAVAAVLGASAVGCDWLLPEPKGSPAPSVSHTAP